MILAAGLGSRMRPLTDHTPKPLLPVADKPLIVYHLERLRDAGVNEVVINTAYLGEKIQAALGDGSGFGVFIRYSCEPEPLETAGAINLALPYLQGEPFILVNGDVWTDYPFAQLVEQPMENALAHLVMVPNPPQKEQGDFSVVDGMLYPRDKTKGYTFSGISLITPELIADYPKRRRAFALREVFDWAMARQRLSAEVYNGVWHDIGTPQRLQQLDAELRCVEEGRA